MNAFSPVVRFIERSQLTSELLAKLTDHQQLKLSGVSRLVKGLVSSAFCGATNQHLLAIAATLEEAGRWSAQLEAMGWQTVHFYPTSEASPYEERHPDTELTWGQMQVLVDLVERTPTSQTAAIAIVTTERALQPHLPPPENFARSCLHLQPGTNLDRKTLDQQLAQLGYQRVAQVETEGQWSRRGDIVDIFPVAAEVPLRLDWFGDELETIREFDPVSQRTFAEAQPVGNLVLTPTDFQYLASVVVDGFTSSLVDYFPENTLVAIDEPDQCQAHNQQWYDHAEEHYQQLSSQGTHYQRRHQNFHEALETTAPFQRIYLSELAIASIKTDGIPETNLASRAVPTLPHQFAKLADTLSQERQNHQIFLISAQPSRSVALLQEHDCPAQFLPNPNDHRAVERLQVQHTPIALKYSGLAEMEGFILPTYRLMLVTDREFFGQHTLATPTYIRKRRRAASKQIDPNQLRPGDYVVHRHHGIGKFLKLESLENREYLVVKYEDGLLRIPADQLGSLSRYRSVNDKPPQLNKLSGKAWEKTKNKVRKTVKKLAVDLLKLYAQRSEQTGIAYPEDMPWQQELEDSFPYQETPDQLKAIQDVKRDLESDRPMDRLVCGDVGFGKTEVAIRAIFKAITAGKQVAFLAPTTILTQQHYHTIKERFAPYPIEVGLLNRFRTTQEKKHLLKRLATGELDVVIGTHQLLNKSVKFQNLGLLVVDEEQRFGVNQKEKIKSMKTQVDVLTLTATPIPRTLYMALSGIREMSVISTPPPSRRPIKTHLAPYESEVVRTALRQELDRGGQIFYVVPRVEGIEEASARVREMVPNARIAIAHGQMDPAELEATMLAFSAGEADILVCTTIIESGLDIPRVNTISIEDAHRFGLSQLYQLRGRVGRSGVQAHAWLFWNPKKQLSDKAKARLKAIQEFTQLGSGYQLAMRDMEIRGVGNLLGAEQSGHMEAIGFDLYVEMLQECIQQIQGQEIPKVDDTQIDLKLTAFIPADYIRDTESKMSAYREAAAATTPEELEQVARSWRDRYGEIPTATQQLLRIMELKLLAKQLGISRIRPEGKQNLVLDTPMEEPAWKLLQENLPANLQSRFVYTPNKIVVRGLGVLPPKDQLENLIDWLGKMKGGLPESQAVS
ncbi:transcription-repair coupling factor [Geitlerinema sp. PCC 9228]|jgi:transcription-repair coupling factor (superfamily II helicase)|uniref:transcription-repair coupling factor n=1 Tax=Geitlerinema sp. PCC 9228 TaxID=111611 RepID=UPI0008F99B99|nr:transcription-repair coupling factor [Geitlerinema sp. PCC 9228]